MYFEDICKASFIRNLAAACAVAAWLAVPPTAGAADLLLKAKPPPQDDLWTRDKLTGDWGGARTALSQRGIEIAFNYVGEVLGLAGGIRQGVSYEHRLELSIDTDLAKLAGWDGASTHVTFYQIGHANGLPAANFTGSIADPSNIEALPATRLFTAWFQKNFFDDKVSIRAGQIAADDEFLISPTATSLINSTFGYATILAANQLQGGPVYPLATPGARLQIRPTGELTFLAAVFSGAPAGAGCTQLPQECNRYGTTFSTSGGTLWMGEAQYGINQGKDAKGMPGVYKLGGWYATTDFADLHFGLNAAAMPVSLASPASVMPLNHQGDWGVYGVADQMIWRNGPQSLNAFARAGASPSDRNLVSFYVDAGLGLKGPIRGRDDDVLTFGFAYSKISPDAAALDLERRFFTAVPNPVRDQEALVELDYSLQIAPWWTLQADLQYIFHPGGNAPDPLNPTQPIQDAFVVGARSTVKF